MWQLLNHQPDQREECEKALKRSVLNKLGAGWIIDPQALSQKGTQGLAITTLTHTGPCLFLGGGEETGLQGLTRVPSSACQEWSTSLKNLDSICPAKASLMQVIPQRCFLPPSVGQVPR